MEEKKQINFEIPAELQKKLKIRCAIRGMKLRDYILQAICEKMAQEEKYENRTN